MRQQVSDQVNLFIYSETYKSVAGAIQIVAFARNVPMEREICYNSSVNAPKVLMVATIPVSTTPKP